RPRRPATRDRRGGTEANRCRARNSHARGVGPAGVRGDAVAGPGRALGHLARDHPSSERPRFAGARAPGGRAPHGEPRRRGAPDDAQAVRRIRARRERKVGGHHPPLGSEGGIARILRSPGRLVDANKISAVTAPAIWADGTGTKLGDSPSAKDSSDDPSVTSMLILTTRRISA